MKNKQILIAAINTFGKEKQQVQAIQELAELQKAITKMIIKEIIKVEYVKNLHEEIADVEIMIDQLKIIHQISTEKIDEIKDKKLSRLSRELDLLNCW